MPLTDYALKEYFSPSIGTLTRNGLIPLQEARANGLLQRFTLMTVLKVTLDKKTRAVIFWLLRKMQYAADCYRSARGELQAFLEGGTGKVSAYLRALTNVENAISCSCQAFEVATKLARIRLFQKRGGSTYERLNRCYIRIKHLEASTLGEDYVQATWLSDDGFHTTDASLTYAEIKGIVDEIVDWGERLSRLEA